MEERILEDEISRGIRYKKNPDGTLELVDATTELAEGEEFVFEVSPVCDLDGEEMDDEDLVDLSPEEAERVRKEKADMANRRRETYISLCEQGKKLLETGSFHASELEYEKALDYDDVATEASVGYWRAKTADFANPDVLASEYVDAGIESLEFDLGYEATEIIKKEYKSVFERRLQELTDEETPLQKTVEATQERRRNILSARKLTAGLLFLLSLLPALGLIIASIVVGMKNFTTPDESYIVPTIVLGCLAFVFFIVFIVFTNKFINATRMYRLNEKLTSTEEGKRLLEIRGYKELYEALLFTGETKDEEPAEA